MEKDEADKAAIEDKTNELMQASMKLGELAYRKAQEESAEASAEGEGAQNEASASDEDVVDADFTDVEVEEDDQKSA